MVILRGVDVSYERGTPVWRVRVEALWTKPPYSKPPSNPSLPRKGGGEGQIRDLFHSGVGFGGRNFRILHHPCPRTLQPTPYTPHSTPYTLHPAPYTLSPGPVVKTESYTPREGPPRARREIVSDVSSSSLFLSSLELSGTKVNEP